MLTHFNRISSRSPRGFLAGAFRAALALGVLALPTLSFGREAPPAGSTLPSELGSTVAGDETIGTLPIVGPAAPFDLMRYLMEREACFFLEGHRIDVFGSVVHAEGRTVATLEVLDPVLDTVRVTFHGRPRLVLDRWMVESGALRLGVDVPTAFGFGSAQAQLGLRRPAALEVAPGNLDLPTAPFLAANLNPNRVAVFEFQGEFGSYTRIGMRATRNFLVVEQTH